MNVVDYTAPPDRIRAARTGCCVSIGQLEGLCARVSHSGIAMRYLVTARLKAGRAAGLARALVDSTLGRGSVAGDEYYRNMETARWLPDGMITWVEVCYCSTPLAEERPYWEEYFELCRIQDAHARSRCRDEAGTEPWACGECDCTRKLEARLAHRGERFAAHLAGLTESSG